MEQCISLDVILLHTIIFSSLYIVPIIFVYVFGSSSHNLIYYVGKLQVEKAKETRQDITAAQVLRCYLTNHIYFAGFTQSTEVARFNVAANLYIK